jgi:hypothetical protein
MNEARNERKFTRRQVLAATATLPLASCLHAITFQPGDPYDPAKFDSWFRAYRLYNGTNPNLKRPHTARGELGTHSRIAWTRVTRLESAIPSQPEK